MTDIEKQKIAAEATHAVLIQTIGNQAMQIAQLSGLLKVAQAEVAQMVAQLRTPSVAGATDGLKVAD